MVKRLSIGLLWLGLIGGVFVNQVFSQGFNLIINGQEHGATMVQGDTLSWQIFLTPGDSAGVQIWLDLNNNDFIDPDTDRTLVQFSQTDGLFQNEEGAPDIDGVANGVIVFALKAGLAPGHYIMVATYNGLSDTSDVQVTPLLAPVYTVSGTVTPPPGQSAALIYVQAEADNDTNQTFWSALTDTNGHYTIDFDSTAVNQAWRIRLGMDENPFPGFIRVPDDSVIILNQNYQGIDFQFIAPNAILAGTVIDFSTGMAPTVPVHVWEQTLSGSSEDADLDSVGNYRFGFFLNFPTGGEVGVWGNNIFQYYMMPNSRKFFLSPGDSLVENFQIYPVDTVITGTIRINGTQVPACSFGVQASDSLIGYSRARSDTAGNFSIPVSSLSQGYWVNLDGAQEDSMRQLGYNLQVSPEGMIPPGGVVSFNFVQGGVIAGRVTDNGVPVSGIRVQFQPVNPMSNWPGPVETNPNGVYFSPPLEAGGYLVQFQLDSLGMQSIFYNEKMDPIAADTVWVVAGDTTRYINLELGHFGKICGQVQTNENGQIVPVFGSQIELINLNNWQSFYTQTDSVTQGFCFPGLVPGDYLIMAQASGFYPQWYNLKPSQDQADTLHLVAGDSINVSFLLEKVQENGVISGIVLDQFTHAPLQGMVVCARDMENAGGFPEDYVRSDTTDAAGQYAIHVKDGTFMVWVESEMGYVRQYFDHQNFDQGFVNMGGNLTPVVIQNSAVVDTVNFDLVRGGYISGHVSDGDSSLAGVMVEFYTPDQNQVGQTQTDSSGNYVSEPLLPGNYFVSFEAPFGYQSQIWNGKYDFSNADTVVVIAGDTTRDVSAVLMPLAHVYGSVYSVDHKGLENISIQAISTATPDTFETYSWYDGNFEFYDLPVGNYIFRAFDPNGVWGTQYWQGVSTSDSATVVALQQGSDVQINFTLRNELAGSVIINEIMWMGSTRSPEDQWVELKNMTSEPIAISGWALAVPNPMDTLRAIIFPDSSVIPAYGYYLISYFPADSSQIAVVPNLVSKKLQMDRHHLWLKLFTKNPMDYGAVLIDEAGNGEMPFAGDSLQFHSMIRVMPPGDGRLPSQWTTSTTSHGWDPGATEYGTPGADNTLPVELSEFSAVVSNGHILLRWTTATESQNFGFDIERRTETSRNNWQKIGFVKGQGTSSDPHLYEFVDSNAGIGRYFYRLKQIDLSGAVTYSKEVEVTYEAPKTFGLKQNYPNPFNPETTIPYTVPEKSHVEIAVYNLLGQKVATLFDGVRKPGLYKAVWNGRDQNGREVGGGMYFIQMRAKNFHQNKKIVLLR